MLKGKENRQLRWCFAYSNDTPRRPAFSKPIAAIKISKTSWINQWLRLWLLLFWNQLRTGVESIQLSLASMLPLHNTSLVYSPSEDMSVSLGWVLGEVTCFSTIWVSTRSTLLTHLDWGICFAKVSDVSGVCKLLENHRPILPRCPPLSLQLVTHGSWSLQPVLSHARAQYPFEYGWAHKVSQPQDDPAPGPKSSSLFIACS